MRTSTTFRPSHMDWADLSARVGHDHREASDRYRGEIHRLGGWRVAVCRGGLQWLVQRQRLDGTRAGSWDSLHFFRSREAVVRLWRRDTRDDGRTLLALLPEHIAALGRAT